MADGTTQARNSVTTKINTLRKKGGQVRLADFDPIARELGTPLWPLFIPEMPAEHLQSDNLRRLIEMVSFYLQGNQPAPWARRRDEADAETFAFRFEQIENAIQRGELAKALEVLSWLRTEVKMVMQNHEETLQEIDSINGAGIGCGIDALKPYTYAGDEKLYDPMIECVRLKLQTSKDRIESLCAGEGDDE